MPGYKHGERDSLDFLVVVNIVAGILTDSETERLQLDKRRSCWKRMIARNALQGRKTINPHYRLCARGKITRLGPALACEAALMQRLLPMLPVDSWRRPVLQEEVGRWHRLPYIRERYGRLVHTCSRPSQLNLKVRRWEPYSHVKCDPEQINVASTFDK